MITISQNAQKHFKSLLLNEPNGTQIRVFIVNPGTSNAECGLAFCSEDEIEKSDIELKYDGFFVYLNEDILVYLKNSEIDLITDKLGSQLTLKAPYAKNNISLKKEELTSLSKKSSSLEERVISFLNQEINPQLSIHGGQVELIKIDANGIALVKFGGGCNGCSMIGLTLKDTVERKILSYFPEIKKVHDETDHLHGQHSFY